MATNSSGYTGVYWNKRAKIWVTSITFKCKNYHLGYFSKIEDAIKTRKTAEEKIFGEFLEWYEKEYKGKLVLNGKGKF